MHKGELQQFIDTGTEHLGGITPPKNVKKRGPNLRGGGPRLGPSRSFLGALLEGTAGRMQCVLFRLANQNTSTANRGAK
jgi:hypothetical protein